MTEESQMTEQELLTNIQILQEQAKVFASNIEMLNMYLEELHRSKVTLEGLEHVKKGDEILVPIGATSFIHARIEDTENVISGIGANVSVDRTVQEAIKNLEERISLTESKINQNQENYTKVASTLEQLSARVRAAYQEKD
ncbi:MAG: prefoldin subunit alpha [Theionarchaea archaeon]|nr:prefoldin subunit alpha [Theionarchaea archaeon]